MTARRVECAGVFGLPCVAHAWIYYSGTGRPVERCPVCWAKHEAERKRQGYTPRRRSPALPSCTCGDCNRCRSRFRMQAMRLRRAGAASLDAAQGGK